MGCIFDVVGQKDRYGTTTIPRGEMRGDCANNARLKDALIKLSKEEECASNMGQR